MKERLKPQIIWLLPLALFLIITPLTPLLDLMVSHYFFQQRFSSNAFYDWIYSYSVFPAQLSCAVAAIILLISYFSPKYVSWRPVAWTLCLNLVIGSGLITHVLLKEFWGRPRPRQIVQFGGKLEFRPYYLPTFGATKEHTRSFPSGHSTTGFYFCCLYFLGKRYRKPWLAYGGLAIALVLGILISWTRILQGGHFISDVLAAALIMWLSAVFTDRLVFTRLLGRDQIPQVP